MAWTKESKASEQFRQIEKKINGGWFFSWFIVGWFSALFDKENKETTTWVKL